MLDVVIATTNRKKLAELRRLMTMPGIRWHGLNEVGSMPQARETGRSFDANAMVKARAAARATGWPAIADDSGLEVDALDGAPGVQSARFAGRHGDDQANTRKLLRLLTGLSASRRTARYRCTLALADPSGRIVLARGSWRGRIAERPAGRGGFGYDPVFVVPGLGKTVGQLPALMKQRLSHRATAARRLRPTLTRLIRRRRHRAGVARHAAAALNGRLPGRDGAGPSGSGRIAATAPGG
jgi:XTP/dITP diphosphohydrolase